MTALIRRGFAARGSPDVADVSFLHVVSPVAGERVSKVGEAVAPAVHADPVGQGRSRRELLDPDEVGKGDSGRSWFDDAGARCMREHRRQDGQPDRIEYRRSPHKGRSGGRPRVGARKYLDAIIQCDGLLGMLRP